MMKLFKICTSFLLLASSLFAQRSDPNFVLPLGIGIASANINPDKPFYFYAIPDFDAVADQLKPIDSVTFKNGQYYIDIATAPPWLAPEHIKLDYQIFNFRVITYSPHWIELIVNNTNGQTAWVDRHAFDYKNWGTFLTEVVTVEIVDVNKNPIRSKPLDNASILAQVPGAQLKPIAVKGDWLMVSTVGLADRIVPNGWIRWRKDNVMLIRYSLLS